VPGWRVEFTVAARRDLRRLSSDMADRVTRFVGGRLSGQIDPRSIGKPLAGRLGGLWRYRIGDLRVIAKIEDGRLLVLIVRVGHRRDVYDR
jgi:mRNA interferase RelE/StbE